jgi:ribosomal protein S20
MKSSIKAFISAETPEKKLKALKNAHSMIDRAARKNVIHDNNAARKKSQLAHAYAKFVKSGS